MRDYLQDRYEASQRKPPHPLGYWLLAAIAVAGAVTLMIAITAHATERAAIQTMDPRHCFATGC